MKALILGISGSIGQECKRKLEEKGYFVYGTSRKDADLILDTSDSKSINSFLEEISKKAPFDLVLTTIANKPVLNKFEEIPLDTFKTDMQVSVFSYIHIFQNLKKYLSKNAHIVFLLTEMIHTNRLGYTSSYVISKYAQKGLFHVLAQEWSNYHVNAISPGLIETNFSSLVPTFIKENYAKKGGLNTVEEVSETLVQILKEQKTGKEYKIWKEE